MRSNNIGMLFTTSTAEDLKYQFRATVRVRFKDNA